METLNPIESPPENSIEILSEMEDQRRQASHKQVTKYLFQIVSLFVIREFIFILKTGGIANKNSFIYVSVLSGIFVALALWSKVKPYLAALSGLCIFIGFVILSISSWVLGYGAEAIPKSFLLNLLFDFYIIILLSTAISKSKQL